MAVGADRRPTGYTTWFYFEVCATAPPTRGGGARAIRLVLRNMNGQKGLYSNGYSVVYASMDAGKGVVGDADADAFFADERHWMRLPSPVDYEMVVIDDKVPAHVNGEDASTDSTSSLNPTKSEKRMQLAFTFHFQYVSERVRFAFCYPYQYTHLQRQLTVLDNKFQHEDWSQSCEQPARSNRGGKEMRDGIYYHRELLTTSLDGLRIDLLTISGTNGLLSTRESALPHLFPHCSTSSGSQQELRPLRFDMVKTKKRYVYITARVHPGETPANFMLDGILKVLLHPTDEDSSALRRHFVFKIIPMLNPDGVCRGYYRTDTRGVNLNRVYEAPDREHAPSIFAARQIMLELSKHGGEDPSRMVFLDLHAHANKRGCFIFGNFVSEPKAPLSLQCKQVTTQVYARLLAANSQYFDYFACSFDEQNMNRKDSRKLNHDDIPTREGCSRVSFFRATGLLYVYTIECNYNEGRRRYEPAVASSNASSTARSLNSTARMLRKAMIDCHDNNSEEPSDNQVPRSRGSSNAAKRLVVKYSPAEWEDVGAGAAVALLDLYQIPGRVHSALRQSPHRSIEGVRKAILSELRAAELCSGRSVIGCPKKTQAVNI
ncbi:TPA: hypothetical protein N0F65_005569 [Lagenidium giganteum]|uniref:tubulin-glutamate carboxypeptidase n=1 Tax=Lagenidium giganteum TaxID=4803 RepID=A0AAV2Z6R8_9STRA|nr:TPA: hypothetical protein N0F65_005569 [Lagenidium giganteum]